MHRHTHRQTKRPTDGIGDKSVRIPVYTLYLLTKATRLKTALDRGSRSDWPRYRATTLTRAGLRRCRLPWPRHVARLAWRDNKNVGYTITAVDNSAGQ